VTYDDPSFPATVRDFYLDEYEVSVGRFRKFVSAWVGGWRPASGRGKHQHLPNGALALTSGTTEIGWDPSWEALIASSSQGFDGNLSCDTGKYTWTPSPALHERMPIGCVTWYEAYAFCIWDGGFLPSEAEWNYAAAAGAEQRAYAWSRPSTSTTIDCSYANYTSVTGDAGRCGSRYSMTDVGFEPNGNGKFGQAGLSGNVQEWTFDVFGPYTPTCLDCANDLPSSGNTASRATRGGTSVAEAASQLASARSAVPAYTRSYTTGIRCARSRNPTGTARDACEDVSEAFARAWDRCGRESYGAARQAFADAFQCSTLTATGYSAQGLESCVAALSTLDCNAVKTGVSPGACAAGSLWLY
jgi:formylglycine-generating enzyme required for sulfatase activity